jgi:hypothetical protein
MRSMAACAFGSCDGGGGMLWQHAVMSETTTISSEEPKRIAPR